MITIEEEIQYLEDFLSRSYGFEINLYAILRIQPIDQGYPPRDWEVSWKEIIDGIEYDSYKEFNSLHDAAKCFVEKRHYLCLGSDFEELVMGGRDSLVEIE